jgi:hypothetical protein
MDLTTKISNKNNTQNIADTAVSVILGETNRINPWSLIKAEKLETQNGMRYSRNVCQ